MKFNLHNNLQLKIVQYPWLIIVFSIFYILCLRGGVILCYGWDLPFEKDVMDQTWGERPRYFPEISAEMLAQDKKDAMEKQRQLQLNEFKIKKYTKPIEIKTTTTEITDSKTTMSVNTLAKTTKDVTPVQVMSIDFTTDNSTAQATFKSNSEVSKIVVYTELELRQERLFALKNEQEKLRELHLKAYQMDIKDVRKLEGEIRQSSMGTQIKISEYNEMQQLRLIQNIRHLPLEEKLEQLRNYILQEITFKDGCCFYHVQPERHCYKPFSKRDLVYETITSPILLSLWRNDDGTKGFYPEEQLLNIFTKEEKENRPLLNHKYVIYIRAHLSLLTFEDNYAKETHGILHNDYVYHEECKIQAFLLDNPNCTRKDFFIHKFLVNNPTCAEEDYSMDGTYHG